MHQGRSSTSGASQRAPLDAGWRCHCPKHTWEFVLECLQDEEEGETPGSMPHLFRGSVCMTTPRGCGTSGKAITGSAMTANIPCCLPAGRSPPSTWTPAAQLAEEAAQAEKRLDPELLQHLKGDDPHLQRYEWLRAMTGTLIGRAKALKKLKRAQGRAHLCPGVLTHHLERVGYPSLATCLHQWRAGSAKRRTATRQARRLPSKRPSQPSGPLWRPLLPLGAVPAGDLSGQARAGTEALVAFSPAPAGLRHHRLDAHHVFTILYGEEGPQRQGIPCSIPSKTSWDRWWGR